MIELITKQTITTSINIHRSVPHVVYCGYEIAIVLRNIEDITLYRISRTRVTRLYVCMCVCVYYYSMCAGRVVTLQINSIWKTHVHVRFDKHVGTLSRHKNYTVFSKGLVVKHPLQISHYSAKASAPCK